MSFQVNPDLIFQILDFGITQDVDLINKALAHAKNDVNGAIEYILQNPNGGGTQPVGDQRPEVQTDFGPGRLNEETFEEIIIDLGWGFLHRPKGKGRVGEIRWTKQRLSKEAVANSENTIYLFGENDLDNFRGKNQEREYIGGMAQACGPFDRSRAYGIVTTFYGSQKPSVSEFQNMVDGHMEDLRRFLSLGMDIVVPQPNIADLDRSQKSYYIGTNQVINHNLGTGLAGLTIQHLLVIENALQNLNERAQNGEIKFTQKGERLIKKENSDIPVPDGYENFFYKAKKAAAKKQEPVMIDNVAFVEGLICLRKGKQCEIMTIDRGIDPPSCTVRMLETNNIVGTELNLLKSLDDQKILPEEEEELKQQSNNNSKPAAVEQIDIPKPEENKKPVADPQPMDLDSPKPKDNENVSLTTEIKNETEPKPQEKKEEINKAAEVSTSSKMDGDDFFDDDYVMVDANQAGN